MAELAKKGDPEWELRRMIDSLRHTHSSLLTLFAACISGAGAVVGVMAPLICGMPVLATGNSSAVVTWRADLQVSAAHASFYLAIISILLMLLSFGALAPAYIKASRGPDDGVVRLVARSIYLLSLLAIIGTVSTVVFLTILQV